MSFNANTLYKAVDVEELAKECKDATMKSDECFVLVGMFGDVVGVYMNKKKALDEAINRNMSESDGYWAVETCTLHRT